MKHNTENILGKVRLRSTSNLGPCSLGATRMALLGMRHIKNPQRKKNEKVCIIEKVNDEPSSLHRAQNHRPIYQL